MAFSPIKGAALIEEQYRRYLSTMFRLNQPVYQAQFEEQINERAVFVAGPYLDAHDHFAAGHTPRELVQEGLLVPYFLKFGFHQDRALYYHQEKALRKALDGKNLVVSTGTGSGKTESFLMPILAELAKEAECGTLGCGVRALLIYPMNALANDQVERLRGLLENTPEITFGCYTGQTRNGYSEALSEYEKLNKKKPAQNELICRDQMKEKPPHLLITNYAMLEYLMVRPGDQALFQGGTWRFVVLDEAHVYRGSTGIEVSMLLRRLKATLGSCALQFFLTSATLGDESENEEVAQFAENLCDCSFSQQDVIRAVRVPMPRAEGPLFVPFSVYREIRTQIEAGVPEKKIVGDLLVQYPQWSLNASKPLFDLVHRDERYWRVRSLLKEPCSIAEISHETKMTAEEIECFVAVASFCEADGIRLLDARYHSFLRATDSVFITLSPSNRLFLKRAKNYWEPSDGKQYCVFEVATCSSCHSIFLQGKLNEQTHCLEQSASFSGKDIFYLGSQLSNTDEDAEADESKTTPGTICAICGHFKRSKVKGEKACEHDPMYHVPVIQLKTKAPDHRLKKCVCCEATNNFGILRSFFTGQEAVTSVIATSLFSALPSQTSVKTITPHSDDDFGFGFDGYSETEVFEQQARQFLCFSDSRQASAYFATYLDATYRKLLYKRCIAEQLKNVNKSISLSAFVEDLSAVFDSKHLLTGTGYRMEKEAWKAILAEMADGNSDNSLSGMGMVSIGLPSGFSPANPMLNMTGEEVTAMFNVLLSSLLLDLALTIPCAMNEEDREFYSYGAMHGRYQMIRTAESYAKSFIPKAETRSNRRLDYLMRMLEKKAPGQYDQKQVRKLMESLWNLLVAKKILVFQDDGYQIHHECLHVLQPAQWYRCSKCHKLTPYDVSGVCPSYQCHGMLERIEPGVEYRNNHYFRLYHDMDIQALRVKEHTAQLDRDQAYQYQQDFKDKKIDVLSCSTTFEMGVDVGSLETVFMRNMPPMPANYAQRAGRAGRSKQSAAFALTFCNRSNHDFAFFDHPKDMISGKIHAPHFSINNEKIAIRHLYASALAFFWRREPSLFSTVDKMANGEEGKNGYALFADYLRQQPEDLKEYLKAFLPSALYERFGCETFAWVDGLINEAEENGGILTNAIKEYSYEVDTLEQARQEAFRNNRSTGYLEQRLRTYRREDILSFLSRRNVMPQYGFPVDTVSLTVASRNGGQQFGVELQRDLAMAISEYAPGSQVVANGELFTGRYIRKIPQIGWKMYDYIYCEHCGTLNIDPHTGNVENDRLGKCKMCAQALNQSQMKTFIVPSFGFEIDPDDIRKPGLIRPEKTYRTDVYYVGYRNNIKMEECRIGRSAAWISFAEKDEMAVLNKSDFHVCEQCGYAQVGENYLKAIQKEHNMASGKKCRNKYLKKFSLGYRFETDVFQLVFPDHPLDGAAMDKAYSVLYALLRGMVQALDLEESDIAGCLQSIHMDNTYALGMIFYDTTPGGAGHVRRLQNVDVLNRSVLNAINIMENCTCGGEEGHASCYACLRNYRNQKLHDYLDRSLAAQYLKRLFE